MKGILVALCRDKGKFVQLQKIWTKRRHRHPSTCHWIWENCCDSSIQIFSLPWARCQNCGGALQDTIPWCLQSRSISLLLRINDLIFIALPHLGQSSGSTSNTSFIHRAQLWVGFGLSSDQLSSGSKLLRRSFSNSAFLRRTPRVLGLYTPKYLVVCSNTRKCPSYPMFPPLP